MIIYESKFNGDQTNELYNKTVKRKFGLFILLLSMLIIIIGVSLIIIDSDNNFFMGLFLIIYGIIFPPLIIFFQKKALKKQSNTLTIVSDETIEKYIFDENQISVEMSKGESYYALTKANYDYLFKAVETNDSFLLYISSVQCHIVFKNCIVEGSNEELREILKRKLDKKFKTNF